MVRLPLHVGNDARRRAAFASVVLALGGLAVQQGWLVLGLGVVAAGIALVVVATRARGSDAVLDAKGLRVEGGRLDGFAIEWRDIKAAELVSDGELYLTPQQGARRLLAAASDEDERASLRALYQTLRDRLGDAPPPAPSRAEIAECKNCRALLPPSADATVACPSCDTPNEVAEALRSQVAAQQKTDSATSAINDGVARLLRQPSAKTANWWLAFAAVISTIGWLPMVASDWVLRPFAMRLDTIAITIGLLDGLALTFAVFSFAKIAILRRRALQVLAASFGARPPVDDKQRPGCRNCGAPLPHSDSAVVRCGYCDVQSILGLELHARLTQAEAHRTSIEALLTDARAAKRAAVIRGAIALLCAAGGGLLVAAQVETTREFIANDIQCRTRRDAEACYRTALTQATGSLGAKNDVEAVALFSMACELGHAEACRDASVRYELGWGAARDATSARQLLERSCNLGWKPACDEAKATHSTVSQ